MFDFSGMAPLTLYAVFSDGTKEELDRYDDDPNETRLDTPHNLHKYWRKTKRQGRKLLFFQYTRTLYGFMGDTEIPHYIRTVRGKERPAHFADILASAITSENPLVSNIAAGFGGMLYKHLRPEEE